MRRNSQASSREPEKPPCGNESTQDDEKRQRLLADQLPQVRFIARRIHEKLPRHVPLDDLVHAGVVGLIDALQKFDRSKHVMFGSYAKFRIRGAILDSLRELDWSPRDLRRQSRRLEESHAKLRMGLGRNPTEPELALEMEIPLPELYKLLSEINTLEIGSLRIVSAVDGKEEDLTEYLSSDKDESPLVQLMRSETRDRLLRAISELPEKERQVLALYYFEELTMKEVGAMLGVGESRISQIHSMAVFRLRTKMGELTAPPLGKNAKSTAAGK
jgi:RNA polymerase sigma factor for flagellar operon FliA